MGKKMKSKLKAVAPKAAKPSKPKVLIFGKPGVGKTWSALDFPNVYYIDTEGGADMGHYTTKLEQSGGVYLGIEQGSLDFTTVLNQVMALATEKHPYKTLVIDSITKIFNNEITKEAERLDFEGKKNEFGIDKKPAVALMKRLVSWLQRLDMNVVMIAHEKPLWFKGEQIGETFDCWDKLEYELHLALQIIKQGGSRIAKVRKSRLLGFDDASSFAWSYKDFADKYGRDIIEGEVLQLTLATISQIKELNNLLETIKLPEGQLSKWLTAANAETISDIDTEKADALIKHIRTKYINQGE